MKLKLLLALCAAGIVWATEEETVPEGMMPAPGNEATVSTEKLMRKALRGPLAGTFVPVTGMPRFVLIEGHLTGDGNAVRRMLRMDVQTGEVWFQHNNQTAKGPVSWWVPIMEEREAIAFRNQMEEQAATEKAKEPKAATKRR